MKHVQVFVLIGDSEVKLMDIAICTDFESFSDPELFFILALNSSLFSHPFLGTITHSFACTRRTTAHPTQLRRQQSGISAASIAGSSGEVVFTFVISTVEEGYNGGRSYCLRAGSSEEFQNLVYALLGKRLVYILPR